MEVDEIHAAMKHQPKFTGLFIHELWRTGREQNLIDVFCHEDTLIMMGCCFVTTQQFYNS